MFLRGREITAKPMLIIVILFTMLVSVSCAKAADGHRIEIQRKEKWTEAGAGIYVLQSEFYLANMTIVTSGKDAALIDTGMGEKDRGLIEDFIKQKNLQLKYIIITHAHDDHIKNLEYFAVQDVITVQPESAEDNQEILLGDKTLKIIFTEGHYKPKGHISVELAEDNVLIAGDVICSNIIPPIAASIEPDFEGLMKTLKQLEAKKYALIIPGHGEIADNKTLFARQFEYLNNAKSLVQKHIAAGGKLTGLSAIKLEQCIKDTSYLHDDRLDYWHIKSLETIYLHLKNIKK